MFIISWWQHICEWPQLAGESVNGLQVMNGVGYEHPVCSIWSELVNFLLSTSNILISFHRVWDLPLPFLPNNLKFILLPLILQWSDASVQPVSCSSRFSFQRTVLQFLFLDSNICSVGHLTFIYSGNSIGIHMVIPDTPCHTLLPMHKILILCKAHKYIFMS